MLLSDALLLNYKRCQRRVFLDTHGDRAQRDPQKDFLLKLRRESLKHAQSFVANSYPVYRQPAGKYRDWHRRSQETEALMRQGEATIYAGVLLQSASRCWQDFFDWEVENTEEFWLLGTPDLLIKQPGKSLYGNWQYVPISIQFGRRPKPEYKMIAAFHAQLLLTIQGVLPPKAEIVLRQHNHYAVNLKSWIPRMQNLLSECGQMLLQQAEPEVFISRQRCNLCHWYSHCYAIARDQNHLSLVPGVTPQRYQHLQSLRIDTVESLADTTSNYTGELLGFDVASRLQQQAQSLVEGQAMLKSKRHSPRSIPTAPIELYFDIEAEPERNLDYLLGVLLVDRRNNTEQFYPFLAETPAEEEKVWQQFLEFVGRYQDAPIFHYSEYEVETVRRLAILYKSPRQSVEQLLTRFVDLHHQVTNTVFLPVESYSLKSLANWLGFQWRDPSASGEQSVCWYDQWLQEGDRTLLTAILRYNEDDCRATRHLKDWLVDFLQLSGNNQPLSIDRRTH